MKNYYLVIVLHLIALIYAILFLYGFFKESLNLYLIGGIGLTLFIFIIIKGQLGNLMTFLLACAVGAGIGYAVNNWYEGIFWISFIFTIGQMFGFKALVENRGNVRIMSDVEKNENGNTSFDRIGIIEIAFFVALLIAPYYASGVVVDNMLPQSEYESEIDQSFEHMSKSIDYSNKAMEIINSSSNSSINQNEIDELVDYMKKAVKEGEKVDIELLNLQTTEFGTAYRDLYLKSRKLVINGFESGKPLNLKEGQRLYENWIVWQKENLFQ